MARLSKPGCSCICILAILSSIPALLVDCMIKHPGCSNVNSKSHRESICSPMSRERLVQMQYVLRRSCLDAASDCNHVACWLCSAGAGEAERAAAAEGHLGSPPREGWEGDAELHDLPALSSQAAANLPGPLPCLPGCPGRQQPYLQVCLLLQWLRTGNSISLSCVHSLHDVWPGTNQLQVHDALRTGS